MEKCFDCKKETDKLSLVSSPDINNALVFVCEDCLVINEHDGENVTVKCNSCDRVNKIGKSGASYMERTVDGKSFVLYCKKCAIGVLLSKANEHIRIVGVNKFKKYFKGDVADAIYKLMGLSTAAANVRKYHPNANVSVYIDKDVVRISSDDAELKLDVLETMWDVLKDYGWGMDETA